MTQQADIEAHINTLLTLKGEDVTLIYGENAIECRGVRGKTVQPAFDTNGLGIEFRAVDFLFNGLKLLDDDDERVKPDRGNQIVAGSDVFTILPLSNEGQAVECRDPFGVMLRCHTKQMTAGTGSTQGGSSFVRRVRQVATVTADTPLEITPTGLKSITSVEVWKRNDNGSLTLVTSGVNVNVTEATPPVVTITSGTTLTNARVFLVGI